MRPVTSSFLGPDIFLSTSFINTRSQYIHVTVRSNRFLINPLNAKLNPICHLLALLGSSTIVVVSRLRVKQPTRRTNYPNLFCYKTLHVSGHRLCPSSGVFFYCTFGAGKFHAGFWRPLPSRVRMEVVLTLLESGQDGSHSDSDWKRSWETCMKLTSAECTVEKSWWWAEKMPETCRVL